eukprot:765572-Hanusia_phi.AAC.2
MASSNDPWNARYRSGNPGLVAQLDWWAALGRPRASMKPFTTCPWTASADDRQPDRKPPQYLIEYNRMLGNRPKTRFREPVNPAYVNYEQCEINPSLVIPPCCVAH